MRAYSQKGRKKHGIEPMYRAIRALIRHLTELCNPTRVLTDGVALAGLDGPVDFPPMHVLRPLTLFPSLLYSHRDHGNFCALTLSQMLWAQFLKWMPELCKHGATLSTDINLVCHVGECVRV